MKALTETQARTLLKHRIAISGLSMSDWARANKFSPAYVSDVCLGKRGMADRISAAIGLKPQRTFHCEYLVKP